MARHSFLEGLLKFNLLLLAILLLVNLAGFIVRLILGTMAINEAINDRNFAALDGFTRLPPNQQLQAFPSLLSSLPGTLLGPGNRASPDFRQANIIAAAVGVAACLVGISHLFRRWDYTRAAASAANLISLALNAVALGLAIKQVIIGRRIPRKLEVLAWITIIQMAPIILYEMILHASWAKHSAYYSSSAHDYPAGEGVAAVHAGGPPKPLPNARTAADYA